MVACRAGRNEPGGPVGPDGLGGLGDGVSSSAGRWATPPRRWHRPSWDEAAGSFFWVTFVAGVLLAATGDWASLVVGSGSMLVGAISSYHHTDEDAPYAKRFPQPPDAATQQLVHDSVSEGRWPPEAALRELALAYAAGWARRVRRGLALAVVVVVGSCLACALLVWLLDQRWPESTPTRSWGVVITVAGAVGWLLTAAVPGMRRLRALRRLQRSA